jgi:tetratricopeptide (TPR) repeat protein
MDEKVLSPSTIIPQSLYVERDADRQVEKVLAHMGRPGYVLVARQMGKTNLLINAKRRFENENDIFVYVDLSNTYKTSQECFRNFINTALESHWDIFKPIIESIHSARKSAESEPHQEHHRELKALLRTIKGKLVFILDEVDALTKTKYSDEIFAQIRSVYFSRINFKESERLTYLLSGVAEPNELIKNKNISPFNIGQKIYLDDFNRDEFNTFIAKTGISFPSEVVDRIFYWGNGNPRITWDVCSEIEDLLLQDKKVTEVDVDAVVSKMYLKAFDRPPVDHIRTIIQKDKELRNSIVSIRYFKGGSLSDSTKSKLYLAGIIGGYLSDNDITIKNRILEASLSEKFLAEIDTKGKGAYQVAIEKYFDHDYAAAIESFSLYLSEVTSLEASAKADIYFKMGDSAFLLENIEEAKTYLHQSIQVSRQKESDTYFQAMFVLGLCESKQGNTSECVVLFERIIDANRQDLIYFKSFLALSTAIKGQKGIDYSINYHRKLIEELESITSRDGANDYVEIRTTAYQTLAFLYLETSQYPLALSSFNNALAIAPKKFKGKLYAGKLRVAVDDETKLQCILSFIGEITSFPNYCENARKSRLFEIDLETFFCVLLSALKLSKLDTFETLFHEYKRVTFAESTDDIVALFALANHALASMDWASARAFLKLIIGKYSNEGQVNFTLYHIAAKSLIASEINLSVPEASSSRAIAEGVYHDCISNANATLSYDYFDVHICARMIFRFLRAGRNDYAIRQLIDVAISAINTLGTSYDINYVWIYFAEMMLATASGSPESMYDFARKVVTVKSKINIYSSKACAFSSKELDLLVARAEHVLKFENTTQSSLGGNKFERNKVLTVRYQNGKIVTKKYKKVSDDLASGECIIVSL